MKLSKKIILLLLLPCLSCFSLINQVLAQEEFEEEALFRFEEYVVSASKRLQRIEEAPATITVITAENIRQSGLTSIPEILRQVAGLDVVTLTAFDTQVAIRGLYGPAANMNVFNKILVLINGRSVYEDPFGGTIWEALPIQLEDIERIEIIKGPGSVLYGANALTGVINIITKSPDESEGGVFSVTDGWFNGSGEINHYIRSLIYGGKIKDFGYRLSGGWESVSRLEEHDKDSEKIGKFLGLFNYKINESSEATLEGGISDGKGEIFVNFPGFLAESQKGYVKANYNYQELKTQVFWRHETFDVPFYAFLGPSPLISLVGLDEFISGSYYTYDIELQQSIKLAEIHTIMGGLNYRYFTLSSNYTEQKGLNTYAGFLQYEIKPLPSIIFNLGVRVDHQNYIGTNVSPRGSLIFTPLKGHIICLSAGSAFRNPAYIDLFTDVSLAGTVVAKGRRDLKPESIISVELGYRASFIERLRANLGVFYNKIEDLIRTFGDYEDFPIRSINYNGAEAIGGEVGLEYKITPWLSGLINYSYQEITYRELPSQELIYQDGEPIESNPKNKLNGGFRVTLKNGFSANILVHYVDTTKREYPIIEELVPDWPLKRLDPYTLLTARISYKLLDDRFEVALAGQNLLNDVHKGVPIIGEEIPLRVYGTLSARF